jgi:predicted nucleotidyltransferase
MQPDPILSELRTRFNRLYGDRLARVVLYGSRARGEAHADYDYDVAVFLRDTKDRWEEFDRITPVETEMLYGSGAVVHAMPFAEGRYHDATPLMGEIRRDGVEL